MVQLSPSKDDPKITSSAKPNNQSSKINLLMSPNDTSSLDKRSWGRSKGFDSDLEYIEMELEWIKARCDWFNYKDRTVSSRSRRSWMDDDEKMLTPSRLKQVIKNKKKEVIYKKRIFLNI